MLLQRAYDDFGETSLEELNGWEDKRVSAVIVHKMV